jgi:PilZ domain
MDRRFETRLPADLPVSVALLDDDSQAVGTLVNISESGICAILSTSLPPGTLVRVDVLEVGLYGEIVYSEPETDCFRTGIFVEQALLETSHVSQIVQTYFDKAASSAGLDAFADTPEPRA